MMGIWGCLTKIAAVCILATFFVLGLRELFVWDFYLVGSTDFILTMNFILCKTFFGLFCEIFGDSGCQQSILGC